MGSGHDDAEVRNRRILIFLGLSFSGIWIRDKRILNVVDEVTEEELSQIVEIRSYTAVCDGWTQEIKADKSGVDEPNLDLL